MRTSQFFLHSALDLNSGFGNLFARQGSQKRRQRALNSRTVYGKAAKMFFLLRSHTARTMWILAAILLSSVRVRFEPSI